MNAHRRCLFLMTLALAGLAHCAPPAQPLPMQPTSVAHAPEVTVDVTATFAMHLIETALSSASTPTHQVMAASTPMPTDTPNPTATATAPPATATPMPTPDLAATQTALAQSLATAIAATLTAQPPPTPDLAATQAALAERMATSVAATLTAQPTATSQPLPPSPTSAAIVAPPTSTVAPPAPVADCLYAVSPPFGAVWNRTEMGCAVGPAQSTWASWTLFEHGHMIWRRDTNTMYVFYNRGQWEAIPDKWDGISVAPSRGTPPAGHQAPIRGAGWVWGNNDAVFQGLGWANAEQKGFCADVQTFEQGFLLQSSTVEFCHEEQLYNVAREPGFGVLFFKANNAGYWQ